MKSVAYLISEITFAGNVDLGLLILSPEFVHKLIISMYNIIYIWFWVLPTIYFLFFKYIKISGSSSTLAKSNGRFF